MGKLTRILSRLIMIALATTAVFAMGGRRSTTGLQVIAEPWSVGGAGISADIVDIKADTGDDMIATLADGRLFRVTTAGKGHLIQSPTIPERTLRRGTFGFVRGGDVRWLVSWPSASIISESGREERTIGIPPRTISSIALANGDLALLTPGAHTLVSIVNRYGVKISEFGTPLDFPEMSAAQNRWLNQGVLLETKRRDILVVFTHLPHPTVRRYSRDGILLSEVMVTSPGLDRIAADAESELHTSLPDSCTGGLITVFAAAYDAVTDTVWLAAASDDGLGYVKVLSADGILVQHVQLLTDPMATPQTPSLLAFSDNYLFWVSGRQIFRVEVASLRSSVQSGRGMLAVIGSHISAVLDARGQPPPCGPAQQLTTDCPYNCRTYTLTCRVDNQPAPWRLEGQACLQPPTTPTGFRGCEKSATWCDVGSLVRDTKTDRKSCGTDADADDWTYEEGDCYDDNIACNPGASAGYGCDLNWGQTSCPSTFDCDCNNTSDCQECGFSPILVDVAGDGFDLTDAVGGVAFDLNGDGTSERLGWPATGSDDSWLVLDRNGNGRVDNGRELFGNFTEQPRSSKANGFIALALFDSSPFGGNQDGWIDTHDTVFARLQLWRDQNHDGTSQPAELTSLADSGIARISLDYQQSRRLDRWGNEFRYRARITSRDFASTAPQAYDVYLRTIGWCNRR